MTGTQTGKFTMFTWFWSCYKFRFTSKLYFTQWHLLQRILPFKENVNKCSRINQFFHSPRYTGQGEPSIWIHNKYKLHLHTDPKTECFHAGLFIILFQCFGVSREVCRGCSLNPLGGVDRRVVFLILFIAAVIIWVTTVIRFDMSATWRNLSRKPFWIVDIAWLQSAILQISSYQIL